MGPGQGDIDWDSSLGESGHLQVHRGDQLPLPRTGAKSFVGQSLARPLSA